MTRRLFLFDTPERFVAGTIGVPGQRTFFIQARSGTRIVSVSLEKIQVALLADRLNALLEELARRAGTGAESAAAHGGEAEGSATGDDDPAVEALAGALTEATRGGAINPDPATVDNGPLDEPLNEVFRAGTLSIGWDPDAGRVVVEAREQVETDDEDDLDDDDDEDEDDDLIDESDDDEDGPDLIRVRLDLDQVRGFIERAATLIAAGRLPCPLCGQPLDPQGHLCPRRNGSYVN